MFKKFLIELRTNKKISRIFWIFWIMIFLLVFLTITWNVSGTFGNGLNGFALARHGVYFIFVNNASRASKAYIIMGAVVAYFPLIILFPIIYFMTANYLINYKIKKHFPQVINYYRWSKIVHLSILSTLFFIIGAIITTVNGGSLKPSESYKVLLWAFNLENLNLHVAGIGMWLVYVGGAFLGLVIVTWIIFIGLVFVFSKASRHFKLKKENKNSNSLNKEIEN
ncbi:hypothetical protein SSABA_v1c03270 [Spiroplasma sabaudiense Ar-1343]|uniref:Transmembrane protein n=1 Tax=Spiroplasma sabaudiense Ar-1343 TaxID=1276257 RepID=W6A9E1_9MOLU|nr:hypothetical protein [Spiroplasma sabaudiense]AHI53738.1 hypothetical protein SSABA_v1c03270 [Spiroplasma sabaudiense Ar-1343]